MRIPLATACSLSLLAAASPLFAQGGGAPPRGGLVTHEAGAFEGYTLFSPLQSGVTFLIDMEGEVVHEWILVDDCVVYDGLTYGDGDGLLLDESAEIHEDELCRLRRLCDEEVWEDPVIEVWATDCGGNMNSASYVKTGTYLAFRCR